MSFCCASSWRTADKQWAIFVTHSCTHLRALFIVHSNIFLAAQNFVSSYSYLQRVLELSGSAGAEEAVIKGFLIWARDKIQLNNVVLDNVNCSSKAVQVWYKPSPLESCLLLAKTLSQRFMFCNSRRFLYIFFPTFQSYRFKKRFLKVCLVPFL